MNSTLVFFEFVTLYLLLIWRAGKTYPILYLFIFIYFVQYIFSTYLIYNEYKILREEMPISQIQYFDYAIPALFSLFLGVLLFNRDIDVRGYLKRINESEAKQLGYLLLIISYAFDLLPHLGITFLDSVISFTEYLKYVAVFCILFTNSRARYFIIGIVYLQLMISVLRGGVFVTFFVWSTFLFFFISLRFNFPFWMRALFIMISVPILIMVQSVKNEYRKATWKRGNEGGVGLFSELVQKNSAKNSDEPFDESNGVVSTVGRLTQGWHLGLTLKRVPLKEPYADGNEMINDIVSSILPRVIFSDKKKVNSQEKFYKYTGHKLRGYTSMSIGVLGDFYINFGRWGSYIMLFVFGALIARLFSLFLKRYVLPDPINIIWIPFILSYLIRGNNDFYIFFNGMVKGFLIFLIVNYVRYRFLDAKKPIEESNHFIA